MEGRECCDVAFQDAELIIPSGQDSGNRPQLQRSGLSKFTPRPEGSLHWIDKSVLDYKARSPCCSSLRSVEVFVESFGA